MAKGDRRGDNAFREHIRKAQERMGDLHHKYCTLCNPGLLKTAPESHSHKSHKKSR